MLFGGLAEFSKPGLEGGAEEGVEEAWCCCCCYNGGLVCYIDGDGGACDEPEDILSLLIFEKTENKGVSCARVKYPY